MAQKTYKQLAQSIYKKSNKELQVKDIERTLCLLEESIVEELDRGNDVKLRSIAKFSMNHYEATSRYDGINKRQYTLPAHRKVSIKPLGKLNNLNTEIKRD